MSKNKQWQFLLGLVLAALVPLAPAHAQNAESWVSSTGDDAQTCLRAAPCQTFAGALAKTSAGGLITVVDTGRYGPVTINKSVTIANDTSGTATISASAILENSGAFTQILIAAGPTDVVTLRGLTILNGFSLTDDAGVTIANAQQVNIEKCVIRHQTAPGILVAPDAGGGQIASSIRLNIADSVVTDSVAGVKITSLANLPVNVSIARSSFSNNNGGGIRADGLTGGPITVAIADSAVSLNASNGVLALSGSSGNVTMNVAHSFIASNGLYGVQSNQSNGGAATVTVNSSTITNNASGATGSFGGGALFSFGDNNVFGPPGTGFSGMIGKQ